MSWRLKRLMGAFDLFFASLVDLRNFLSKVLSLVPIALEFENSNQRQQCFDEHVMVS